MCGNVRAGAGSSPAGAKESRLARERGGAGLWSEGPMIRIRSSCPSTLLLSAGKGAWSISTPSIAKLEKGQGMEENDPDPILSFQAFGTGEGLCVCAMCVHVSLCVCLLSRAVCPCAPVPQLSTPGCLSPMGLLSSGNKAGFLVSKDGERHPGCIGMGFGVVGREGVPSPKKREGVPEEKSPFCAKSLSAIWWPCVQHDYLLA